MRISLEVIRGELGRPRTFSQDVIRVGRDLSNDFVLPEQTSVSRHHAEIRHVGDRWQIVDIESRNGTFLNAHRVQEAILHDGDEISFSSHGPRVRVSIPTAESHAARTRAEGTTPDASPGRSLSPPAPEGMSRLAQSVILPLRMGLRPLFEKAYLPHALVTIVAMTGFVWAMGSYESHFVNAAKALEGAQGDPILGAREVIAAGDALEMAVYILVYFLTAASVYAVYIVAGRRKPWWLLLGTAGLTAVLVPIVFPVLIKPFEAIAKLAVGHADVNLMPVGDRIAYYFFVAAVPEELIKIAPALLALALMRHNQQRGGSTEFQSHLEVREPLDGILLGVASAAGFIALEGVAYAVQGMNAALDPVHQALKTHEAVAELSQTALSALIGTMGAGAGALTQAVFRGLGVFGHIAYSGILGYYVGQAAIRPAHGWTLVLIGYAIAVALHSAWNGLADIRAMMLFIPLCAYALLAACILRARKDSPTRGQNFATNLAGSA